MRRILSASSGQALVETVLVLPILLVLFFGMMSLFLAYSVRQSAVNADQITLTNALAKTPIHTVATDIAAQLALAPSLHTQTITVFWIHDQGNPQEYTVTGQGQPTANPSGSSCATLQATGTWACATVTSHHGNNDGNNGPRSVRVAFQLMNYPVLGPTLGVLPASFSWTFAPIAATIPPGSQNPEWASGSPSSSPSSSPPWGNPNPPHHSD